MVGGQILLALGRKIHQPQRRCQRQLAAVQQLEQAAVQTAQPHIPRDLAGGEVVFFADLFIL